jgi:hypothetical protein
MIEIKFKVNGEEITLNCPVYQSVLNEMALDDVAKYVLTEKLLKEEDLVSVKVIN